MKMDVKTYLATRKLFEAVAAGNAQACRELLQGCVDVHALDSETERRTVLHRLAISGCREAAEVGAVLLEYGAKVDAKDRFGTTPLAWAIGRDHFHIVHFLVESGADVNLISDEVCGTSTPLINAASTGNVRAFSYLLEKGADLHAMVRVFHDRMTALHVAARNGKAEIIRLCVKNGADLNQRTERGRSLAQLAGKYREVKDLLVVLKEREAISKAGAGTPSSDALASRETSGAPTAAPRLKGMSLF